MDRYTPETIAAVNDYFGYFDGEFHYEFSPDLPIFDYYEDEALEAFVEDIVKQYLKGYDVSSLEGFAIDGQKCVESGYPYFRVKEDK